MFVAEFILHLHYNSSEYERLQETNIGDCLDEPLG